MFPDITSYQAAFACKSVRDICWEEVPKLSVMAKSGISGRNDEVSQIKNELALPFNEQTEFFRKGARAKHTETELAEYEKRRERIRGLFAELDELRKATRVAALMAEMTPENKAESLNGIHWVFLIFCSRPSERC